MNKVFNGDDFVFVNNISSSSYNDYVESKGSNGKKGSSPVKCLVAFALMATMAYGAHGIVKNFEKNSNDNSDQISKYENESYVEGEVKVFEPGTHLFEMKVKTEEFNSDDLDIPEGYECFSYEDNGYTNIFIVNTEVVRASASFDPHTNSVQFWTYGTPVKDYNKVPAKVKSLML